MLRGIDLNKGWQFTGPDGKTIPVDLPHTWNNLDGQDGGDNYWRGTCTYRRTFPMPELQEGQRVYLEFQGANASATVTLGDRTLGAHHGGYSTFRFDITEDLRQENLLAVAVDNSKNDFVYPQKADFTFYGGIYRDVRLLIVNRLHFDLDCLGGPGIRVTAKPADNYTRGIVTVDTWKNAEEGQVHVSILDADGNAVAQGDGTSVTLELDDVHLWNGLESPYLYQAVATLTLDGVEMDRVCTRFGVRDFHVEPKKGFFLNGKLYPLHGVSRHQDWKGIGNALTRQHHDADMALIREIGANTLRLAHYQHDQYFYDLCDENGIIVWAEIPYISEHMPKGRENTVSQAKELVIQNYNHPCIIAWGVSNEITISTRDKQDMLSNHRQLNDLYHELDPTRLTTLACYAMCGPFNRSAHITDVVSWNLYLGWYVPGLFLNDLWIGFFHLCYPNRLLGYSEYGCEAMPNLHSSHPRRGDHTEEYQCVYHEYLLRCFRRHPYLWATHVWNMFDFAADARNQGGEPGMNHKGLVTFDRKVKKDSFYLYKAYWSGEPFVHICSKRYENRTEAKITLRVYSNQPSVTLYVDGKEFASKTGDKVFVFPKVPLSETTRIRVTAGTLEDRATFRKVPSPDQSYRLRPTDGKGENWV